MVYWDQHNSRYVAGKKESPVDQAVVAAADWPGQFPHDPSRSRGWLRAMVPAWVPAAVQSRIRSIFPFPFAPEMLSPCLAQNWDWPDTVPCSPVCSWSTGVAPCALPFPCPRGPAAITVAGNNTRPRRRHTASIFLILGSPLFRVAGRVPGHHTPWDGGNKGISRTESYGSENRGIRRV